MFGTVTPQVSFPELDERWLKLWEDHQVFKQSVDARQDKTPFVFYEGPPTANGMPHPGHVLTRIMKDVFLRYKTMDGYHVPRRAGWDTHGLPVEVEVEKTLGINGRGGIEEFGVEEFSLRCMNSVFKYIDEWRRMTNRIGFWVDLDTAYVTFRKSYVESVWWALSELFKQGLLYQDYKVVWWWPQGGTGLSAGEVGLGYKTVDDPSVVVRFPVVGEAKTSFLAWTTTPWTLPSNIALAVDPEKNYATVEVENGERLVLAEALVEKVLGDAEHKVIETKLGRAWCGASYTAPFSYAEPEGGPAHVVIEADFVTLDSGTGMVHLAPAFGEDDFRVAKTAGLGFLQLVKPDGTFPDEVTDFAGRFCKEADRDIIRNLRSRDLLFKEEVYRHEYPFCWRKDTDPLIQYARRSWFVRTTEKIDQVIVNNSEVGWEPGHIREGRMGSFLRSNVDWALSRERFWATPLPIWINDVTGDIQVVSSVDDILAKNPTAFAAFDAAKEANPELSEDLRVHKPWIDEITWTVDGTPGVYRRSPDVIDCWFDSGCMPFAQWGYPHQNKDEFERAFPADFITEALDQTRGWFYSLMMINTLLFPDRPAPRPFKNCVVLGLICDEKGQKLSKSKKNYTDPLELIDTHGADAVRWALYTGTVPGQNTRFFEGSVVDALREFLLKIWNTYSFFVTYAEIDAWDPNAPRPSLSERSDLDRWILAELDATLREVRGHLDSFRSHLAARRLGAFCDALSNWYVRRSRERFWASGETKDKAAAFSTLYEVLVDLSRITAPFVPFLSETLYQNLVRSVDEKASLSVHLLDYPEPEDARCDDVLRETMSAVRDVVTLGQRVRAERKLKVRQPLGEAIVVVADDGERSRIDAFSDAIRQELNVQTLSFTQEPAKYVDFALLPNFRVLGPKLGKRIPLVKKLLGEADGSALHAEMEAKGFISIEVEGESIELGPEEVQVRLQAKDDFAASAAGGRVVVLDTRITEELQHAGYAREMINRIQRARKSMDLAYEARIELHYEAATPLLAALETHHARIASETLASSFQAGEAIEGAELVETTIDDHAFRFWIASTSKA